MIHVQIGDFENIRIKFGYSLDKVEKTTLYKFYSDFIDPHFIQIYPNFFRRRSG